MRDGIFNAALAILLTLVSTYLVLKLYNLNNKYQQRIQELESIIESLKD